MMVCCCSNPACMVNGCMQAKSLREEFSQQAPSTCPEIPTIVFPPKQSGLTEEDVRRIIRDEITKVLTELIQKNQEKLKGQKFFVYGIYDIDAESI